MKKGAWLFIVIVILWGNVSAAATSQVYSTWDTMELDKIASFWLIKRFLDPAAAFRFYPQGTMEMEGVQVDTPTARYRRSHQAATFESLLKIHNLKDPALVYLGQVVRDVEINLWAAKKLPESQGVDLIIRGVILASQNSQECLDRGFPVLDYLYRAIAARNKVSP